MFRLAAAIAACIALSSVARAQPKDREKKVRDDRAKVEAAGFWIYNDLPRAFAESRQSGKPMVVVLRCIPCEECVKLDDELVDEDPRLRPLLDRFVRVRVVSANGLDLARFQFDTDQSFAAFLLNPDGTIYGRFGTRSHRTNWVGDVSIEGLAKALEGALAMHANHAAVKASLAGKAGPAPEFATPELFPSLKAKYSGKLSEGGNVVQSCIHCHQIGDARKTFHRQRDGTLPEEVLFPYPHPKSLGLILDPKERATAIGVTDGSLAHAAGFRAGDVLASMNGQPLLSMADVQWVLHRTPGEGGTVKAEVQRGDKAETLTLALPTGWRRNGDLSWRSSSWTLRRMATGFMSLEDVPTEEREKTGAALRVKFVGQFGPAAGKAAGFKAGDAILAWDGKRDFTRETDILAHGLTAHKVGDKVNVTVLRAGKRLDLVLPMQE